MCHDWVAWVHVSKHDIHIIEVWIFLERVLFDPTVVFVNSNDFVPKFA